MFVHVPVVLALVGVPVALAAAIGLRNCTLRVLAIVWYAALVVAAFVTVNSGDNAQHALGAISAQADEILDHHESMANQVWLFAACTLALVSLAALKHPLLRPIAAWLSVLASTATFLWVAQTANYGGTLVYHHGVGVPAGDAETSPANQPNRSAAPAASSDPKVEFFQQRIQPILQDNCMRCHNPARVASGKSGKLDQTTRDGLLRGGKGGPAIVVGDPDDSLLIQRVTSENEDERMPRPPRARLSSEQIASLKQWIRDGAVWAGDSPVPSPATPERQERSHSVQNGGHCTMLSRFQGADRPLVCISMQLQANNARMTCEFRQSSLTGGK
jgi:uncharacterized membrane protein/mono/diheme cytochrome c family protein